jgi:hypothetical protein
VVALRVQLALLGALALDSRIGAPQLSGAFFAWAAVGRLTRCWPTSRWSRRSSVVVSQSVALHKLETCSARRSDLRLGEVPTALGYGDPLSTSACC